MKYYSENANSVLNSLETNANGLSKSEADIRNSRYGINKLPDEKRTSTFVKFLLQFKDVMVIILLIALLSFHYYCLCCSFYFWEVTFVYSI